MSKSADATSPDADDLDTLLAELFETPLSNDQWDRLRAILTANPSLRKRYRRLVRIHALLESELQWPLELVRHAPIGPTAMGTSSTTLHDTMVMQAIKQPDKNTDGTQTGDPGAQLPAISTRRNHRHWWVWAAAALLVVTTTISIPIMLHRPTVATLTGDIGAQWEGTRPPKLGAPLETGERRLIKGMAQITFAGGALVMVEAPARFELSSASTMALLSGKLSATVPPPAAGFQVSTPTAQVADLGTEFGVRVNAAGETDVHVLQGRVLLTSNANAATQQTVKTGAARRMDTHQQILDIPLEPRQYEFAARLDAASAFGRWMAHDRQIRVDRALLAYYTFEKNELDTSILVNNAPTGSIVNGLIENAQWANGRFPGKAGLRFQGSSDRVRLNVPGEHKSMTVWTWVRVAALERDYTTLLASNDWERPGLLHWNLLKDGGVELGTWSTANAEMTSRWIAPARVVPTVPSGWIMLSVAYQADRGARFYVNGEPIGPWVKSDFDDPGFTIGAAQVGNWNKESRSFRGWMDELGILARTMTDSEIRQLYNSTKP